MSTVRAKSGAMPIVEPVRVGEPGVRLGQGHEVPGPGMLQADLAALLAGEDQGDSRLLDEELADAVEVLSLADVDVGELVIADGEGPAGEGVERLAERPGPDGEQVRPCGARD